THPWRNSITDADVRAFREKLSGLSDRLIERVVKSAELGGPQLESDVIARIERRRDILQQEWSSADLPGRPAEDLKAAAGELPPELRTFEPLRNQYNPEKSAEFNKLRLKYALNLERILRAFATGESINRDDAYHAFDHLSALS